MRHTKQLLIAVMMVGSAGVMAQNASGSDSASGPTTDPKRWTTEDRTPQQRYQTLKNEAAAAYREAQAECRKMKGAEAKTCMKEARTNYDGDLAAAKTTMKE